MTQNSRSTQKQQKVVVSTRIPSDLKYYLDKAQARMMTQNTSETAYIIILRWVERERRKGGVLYGCEPPPR